MADEKKQKRWLLDLLIGLIILAYGFIFSNLYDDVRKNETDIKAINPVFTEIKTDLAEIKTDIKWIKEK